MLKERFKTYLLAALIVSSLFLSFFVWFNESLWPGGYRFPINLRVTAFFRDLFSKGEEFSIPIENLSRPKKIVVHNGGERAVYYNTHPSFEQLFVISKNAMSEFLKDKTNVGYHSRVSQEEWYAALYQGPSVYLDYSLVFTPKLFARLLDVSDTWFGADIGAVGDFLFVPPSAGESYAIAYVRDMRGSVINKYYIFAAKNPWLEDAISRYAINQDENYFFSFEARLNETDQSRGVAINPLVLFSILPVETPVIRGLNPLDKSGLSQQRLLLAFGYNPQSTRKFSTSEGVMQYIETYSTLKIYPSGLIQYKATEDSKGYRLFEEGEKENLYETVNRAIEFVQAIWESVEPEKPLNMLVSSNLLEDARRPGAYNFTLDYYFEGLPVTVGIDIEGEKKLGHAVEIEVKNGVVTECRIYLRDFKRLAEEHLNPPMIDVLDWAYLRMGTTRIKDIYLSYKDEGGGAPEKTRWCIQAEDGGALWYEEQ